MGEERTPLSAGVVVAETYEIERLLGRGGMGEVWLARHRRLASKQVAVKVLRFSHEQLSAELVSRFRREAEIAARLEHPNIVQVIDFNQLPSGEPYLVMELLKGESLAARLRLGPMSVEQSQAVIRQVGAALQAAHAHGVVHRDLKPDNIYLVPTALGDQVKVLDFGISKLAESSSVQTTDQQLLGTPLYMSPEQGLGQNRDVGVQSDLFSLGSICYEMLTGKAPFMAESIAQIVFRIAYQPHDPLAVLLPNAPENVVKAIEHSLQKDRSLRTPDIVTFVREFTGHQLETVASRPSAARGGGVATAGTPGSDSLMMGATAAPLSGHQPAPSSPSTAPQQMTTKPVNVDLNSEPLRPGIPTAPARPSTLPTNIESKRSLLPMIGALVGVAVVAVIVTVLLVRPGAIASAPAVPPVAQPVPTPVPVAVKPATPVEPAPEVIPAPHAMPVPEQAAAAVDAGAPEPVPAHATPTPEGVKPETPKPESPKHEKLAPLEGEDKVTVQEMRDIAKRKEWDTLSRRTGAYLKMQSAAGRREGLIILIEAECARSDLSRVNALYNRLDDRPSKARALDVCRRHIKDWSP